MHLAETWKKNSNAKREYRFPVEKGKEYDIEKECENALQQITDVRYTESLEQEGIHKIIKYGIACYKKKCKVMMKIEE